jgi:hypothetical protein
MAALCAGEKSAADFLQRRFSSAAGSASIDFLVNGQALSFVID